jgi:hypothetical protein
MMLRNVILKIITSYKNDKMTRFFTLKGTLSEKKCARKANMGMHWALNMSR